MRSPNRLSFLLVTALFLRPFPARADAWWKQWWSDTLQNSAQSGGAHASGAGASEARDATTGGSGANSTGTGANSSGSGGFLPSPPPLAPAPAPPAPRPAPKPPKPAAAEVPAAEPEPAAETAAPAIPVGDVGQMSGYNLGGPVGDPYGYHNVQGAAEARTPPPGAAPIAAVPDPLKNGVRDAGGAPASAPAAFPPPSASPKAEPAPEYVWDRAVAPPAGPVAAIRPRERAAGLLREAAGRFGMKAWAEAAEGAVEARRLDPQSADAALLAARALERLRRYDDAETHAADAARLRPGDAQALKALALARRGRGLLSQALDAAREALRAAPADAEAWMIEADLYDALGDRAGALDALRHAAGLDPRYAAMLRRAQGGARIRYADPEEALGLDELSNPVRSRAGAAAAAALLAAGLGAGLWRRSRRAATVPRSRVLAADPSAPARFEEKYETRRSLGRGAAGERLEAKDRVLERLVTVEKVAGLSPAAREALLAAARRAASIWHPAIVELYDVVEERDAVYLVFEAAGGPTLRERVRDAGTLALPEAARLLLPVGEALRFAHSKGIVHGGLDAAALHVADSATLRVFGFGLFPASASPTEAARRADFEALARCLVEACPAAGADPAWRAAGGDVLARLRAAAG